MKIKSKLAAGHLTSAAHIHVDTDSDGMVWLRGTARSEQEWSARCRARAARSTSSPSTTN